MNSQKSLLPCELDRRGLPLVLAALAWAALFLGSVWLLKNVQLPTSARLGLALLPAIPFAVFLVAFINHLRRLDEMQRRIHLEALAIAFPLAVLLLMTLGSLERAGLITVEGRFFRDLWGFLPVLYAIGLAIACRRYR